MSDGALLLDKPLGLSSNAALQAAKRALHARKAGHAGTLDPAHVQDASEGLKRAAGFLRSQLAKRIKLYTTPQLRFEYDESVERGDRLSRLIDAANRKK